MQTALTPRQAAFVDEFVLCGNAAEAARRAGYSAVSAKVTACRMLTKANLKAAIEAKKQAIAVETELRKEHVIAAVLEAIRMAKEQGAPSVMISGWVQLARMCGFLDATEVVSSGEGERFSNGFRFMPTAHLLKRIEEDGDLRNPDGSAMRLADIDRFYEALSVEDLRALAEGRARIVTRVEEFGD